MWAPSADVAKSQIAYAPGHLADAKTLATTLIGGADLVEDPSLSAPNLTLILGPGFRGIRPPAGSSAAADGGSGSGEGAGTGGSGSGAKKRPKAKKAVPDLRPYDPRPC